MPPFQLVRSALRAGRSVTDPKSGSWRFQPALIVMLNAWPVVDDGGAKSIAPKTSPLSTSRLFGIPPTDVGTLCWPSTLSSRWTESVATPAACRPTLPVLSSVW
jgi:hypothetical protein